MKQIMFGASALLFAGGLVVSAQGGNNASSTTAAPTFSKDVAPIFYRSCTGCHRPGEIAPMSLLTYREARPWASSIRQKVSTGVMPPWHADPAHGEFANDRRLTDVEKDTVVKWAAGGAP